VAWDTGATNPATNRNARDGKSYNADITITGSASDNNGIKSLELYNGSTFLSAIAGTSTGPGAVNWAATVPVATNGVMVLTVKATDNFDRVNTTTQNVTVTMDNVLPPAPTVTSAIPTYVTGTLDISGTASDALSGPKTVEYELDGSGTWTALTGNSNWYGTTTSVAAEGPHTVRVRTTDQAGNVGIAYDTKTFLVDTALPVTTVEHNDLGDWSGTIYMNAPFKLDGNATDTNGITSVVVTGSAGSGVTTSSFTTGTWSISSITPSMGSHDYTIVVTDGAGRTNTFTKTIVYDATPPVIDGTVTDLRTGWKTSATQVLSGGASDVGSSLLRIEYRKSSDGGATWDFLPTQDWNTFNGTSLFSGTVSFVEGTGNRIQIRAIDIAGNKSVPVDGTLTGQSISIDSETPDVDVNPPTATPYSNKTLPLNMDVTGTDIPVSGTYTTSEPVKAYASLDKTFASGVLSADLSSPTYAATIDVHTLFASSSGAVKVYFRVKDNAGLYSVPLAQQVIVDITPPAAEITSHSNGDKVNKTITLSGTASDNYGLAETNPISIEVYKDTTGSSTWNWIPAETGTLTQGSVWTLTGFNTASITTNASRYDTDITTGGVQLRIRVVSKDIAGNASSQDTSPAAIAKYERTITVDQDTDRPVIKFNNISLAGMTSINPIWLKGSSVLYGTVTDDDGIHTDADGKGGLFVSSDGGSSWADITVSNGSWTYTLSTDASYTLLFKVTDAATGVFTASATDSYSLTAPKLIDTTTNTFGYIDSPIKATALYLNVDTQSPGVTTPEYYTGSAWSNAIATQSFGGTTTTLRIHQYTYDASLIASVGIKVDSTNFVDATGVVYTYAAAKQSGQTTVVDGKTYTAYQADIDISKLASGSRSMYITVIDNAGMETKTTVSFVVDNTAPTLTLDTHADNEQVSGSVTLKGTTGGSATTLLYKVTDSPATPTVWTVPADYSTYGAHQVLGALSSWRVNFDDDVLNSESFTHDQYLKKYIVMLNSNLEINGTGSVVYKVAVGGHAVGDKYTDIVTLYFHFKATDAYGNTDNTIYHFLRVDPQGDIPLVQLTYPTVSSYGWHNGATCVYTTSQTPATGAAVYNNIAATVSSGTVSAYDYTAKTITVSGTVYSCFGGNTIQGGIIRIQGSAQDDKAISGIYIQIDPAYNSSIGFTWDPTGNASLPGSAAKLGAKYTIADIGLTGKKGIKVGNSVSWNFTLNQSSEFNSASGTNLIGVRVYVIDTDGNINSPDKSDDCIITIDSAAPKIGSTHPLYLYQYTDNNDPTTAVLASREYTDGMWLNGQWWLVGSIEDESGISLATITEGTTTTPLAHYNDWSVVPLVTTTAGFDFKTKIGSSTSNDFGVKTYTLFTKDGSTDQTASTKIITINYDNKAPELAATTNANYLISPKVVQSNGFYTLGSVVTEASSGTASQSGFSRVAVYFLRRGATDPNKAVYDTYLTKGTTGNKLSIKDTVNISYDSGLYWKKVSVGRARANLMTLTGVTDPNVHTGGIVKIGGSIYRVSNVSGTTVTINGSPAYSAVPDTTTETVLFAIAQIVDHKLAESNGTSLGTNGYFTDVVNDDNDNMVEKVVTQGATSIWEANINSRNIPDGPIEIHYVAFDEAGNYSVGVVGNTPAYAGSEPDPVTVYAYDAANPASISNNTPRLAAVKYGTDDDGSGTVDSTELSFSEMFAVYTSGVNSGKYNPSALMTSYTVNGGASALNAKGATKIVPEVVGGNGNLYYSYAVKDSSGTTYYTKDIQPLGVSGTDFTGTGAAAEIQNTAINFSLVDFLSAGSTGAEIVDGDDQTFVFKIWDSTDESSAAAHTSQNATLTMKMNVALRDGKEPTVRLNPFYWNSNTDNSVDKVTDSGTGITTLNGHIELAGSTVYLNGTATATIRTTPAVSGTVLLSGTINDNQRVNKIYITIPGWNSGNKILAATYNTASTPFTPNGSLPAGVTFNAVNVSFDNTTGHTVNWTMIWDTSSIATHAANNKTVIIEAEDLGSPGLSGSTVVYGTPKGSLLAESPASAAYTQVPTTNALFDKTQWYYVKSGAVYNITPINSTTFAAAATAGTLYTRTYTNNPGYTMDIVPYIAKIKTKLSDLKKGNWSVYNRTTLGHYSVNDNEAITVYGFNLVGAKVTAPTAITPSLVTARDSIGGIDDNAKTYDNFPLSTSALTTSGKLTVSGSGNTVDALNNTNDNSVDYNQQHNGDSNNLLTDDAFFDVWQINSSAANSRTGGKITEPVMKIDPKTGIVGFAFANGTDSFSMPNGTGASTTTKSYQWWQLNYDDFAGVSFVYDSAGKSHGIAMGRDLNVTTGQEYAGRMTYMTSKWGRSTTYNQPYENFSYNRKILLESLGLPSAIFINGSTTATAVMLDKNRLRSPSLAVATHAAGEAVYLAYYDAMNQQIRFRSGTNTLSDNTTQQSFGQFVNAWGYQNGSLTPANTATNNPGDFTTHRVFETLPTSYSLIAGKQYNPAFANTLINDTHNTAGPYVAIDVIPSANLGLADSIDNDVVVVVWYDGTNLNYIYRYGVKDDTDASSAAVTAKWSKPIVIFNGIGKYCTIAADKKNGVHIAAYDNGEGALMYAYLPLYSSTTPQTCVVDAYGIVGNHISIDTALVSTGLASPDDYVAVPYISYYMGSQEKPKFAYPALTPAALVTNHAPQGGSITNDFYTGNWEVSVIPTSSALVEGLINVGVWKDSSTGVKITNPLPANATNVNSPGTDIGAFYGNNTANPLVGYAIEVGNTGYIETAQKK